MNKKLLFVLSLIAFMIIFSLCINVDITGAATVRITAGETPSLNENTTWQANLTGLGWGLFRLG